MKCIMKFAPKKQTIGTFPHDIVEELHDGDSAVGITVEQLGVDFGCEELSERERRE